MTLTLVSNVCVCFGRVAVLLVLLNTDEDKRKIRFALEALNGEDPFELVGELPLDVEEALAWQESRTPLEVIQEREAIMTNLEAAGQAMWEKGLCADWLRGADTWVAKVSATVNGVLLTDLCRAIDYRDFECVEMLRTGNLLFECVPQCAQFSLAYAWQAPACMVSWSSVGWVSLRLVSRTGPNRMYGLPALAVTPMC